jgi:Tfp pilus assembly protein PilX
MRTSLTTAQAIMRDRLDQKRMAQDADYRNRSLAMRAAEAGGRPPAISQVAAEIMADPSFKGSKMDAMRMASGLINGVDIRTDASNRQKYAEAVAKATNILNIEMQAAKTPEQKAGIQKRMNEVEARLAERYGLAPASSGSGLSAAELSQVQADISKYLNPGK